MDSLKISILILLYFFSFLLHGIGLKEIDKLHHDGKYQEAYDELIKVFDPQNPDPALIWRIGEEIFVIADQIPDYSRKQKLEKYDEGVSFLDKYLSINTGSVRERAAIIHWYTSNLALKYFTIGIFESIKNLSKIKDLNDLAIKTDLSYADPYYFKANLLDILPGFMGGDEVKMCYYYSLAIRYAPYDINILIDGAKTFYKRNWQTARIKKEYQMENLPYPVVNDREYSIVLIDNAIEVYETDNNPSAHDKIKIKEAYRLQKRWKNQ
jgi:hypothetical protein